jgi:hypothetical protein
MYKKEQQHMWKGVTISAKKTIKLAKKSNNKHKKEQQQTWIGTTFEEEQ